MMRHVNIKISGRVQGVFFRASTKERADALGLSGFVRNEPDGGVYVEAEGSEAAVEKLVVWCHSGPPKARVETVETNEGNATGFNGFEVRRKV